ncbi:hypothetical protein KUTeg_001299 [Tegillarca granosa]|uniref:BTB domain-containing protein n=1 Tax=Tegillarca granosa TaxID=220873 RepID=A0ABQ9FVA2_TEGGR|nr:hypothetical protein KUTeg_001299 [Tegillarca granosa]
MLLKRGVKRSKHDTDDSMSEKSWLKDTSFLLAKGLGALRADGSLTDITIKIDTESFRCHKVVLAAVSPYFQVMFTSDFKESREPEVELKDISSEAFRVILSYIHAEDNGLSESNISDVLKAASMLQIDCVVRRCEEFLMDHLSVDNCLNVWKVCSLYRCSVAEKCFQFILYNFIQVCSGESFLELTQEELSQIISQDNLKVKSEEQVCDAVMWWLKKDYTFRKEALSELMKFVRIPLLRSRYLRKLMKSMPIFQEDVRVSSILNHGLQLIAIPESRMSSSTGSSFHRSHMENADVFVIGHISVNPERKVLVMFDFLSQKLLFSPRFDNIKISDLLYTNNNIYMLGSVYNMPSKLYVVDVSDNTDEVLRDVTVSLKSIFTFSSKAFMTPIDDGIWFIQRKNETDSNSVKYKFSSHVLDLDISVPLLENACTVATSQTIYLFSNQGDDIGCIYECDPINGTIHLTGNLTNECSFRKAMVEDDVIFVLFQDGSVWKLTESQNENVFDQELLLTIPNFDPPAEFSATIHLSKMYIFIAASQIKIVDLKTRGVSNLHVKTPDLCSCHFSNKVVIPKLFGKKDLRSC